MFCRNVCTQSRQVNVSMRQIGEPNVNLPDVTAAWPDCLGDSEGHMLVGRDCYGKVGTWLGRKRL